MTLDFTTGVPLIQLLEIIGEESIPKYNKSPKMRIQRVENVNKALEFIKYRGVPLTNIGAEGRARQATGSLSVCSDVVLMIRYCGWQ